MFKAKRSLALKNTNLRSRTRDLLLPKLISGEIDVSAWADTGIREEVSQKSIRKAAFSMEERQPAEVIDPVSLVRQSLWE